MTTPVGRPGPQGHRQVGDPGVAEVEHVAGGQPHRGRLVGEHVRHPRVHRRARSHQGDAARQQVVDDRVVALPAQGEDGRVDGLGRELGEGPLGVLDRLGHEQHRAPRGVELLGEAVEHGEGERVVEGVAQRPLDDHRHGAHAALAQRRGERVGAGVRQVGCRGAHPLLRSPSRPAPCR